MDDTMGLNEQEKRSNGHFEKAGGDFPLRYETCYLELEAENPLQSLCTSHVIEHIQCSQVPTGPRVPR